MQIDWDSIQVIAVAFGIGLLIGVERERGQRRSHPELKTAAGVRSFTVASVLGSLAEGFGPAVLLTCLAAVALFALIGYWRTSKQEPGMTTELALLATVLLGALSRQQPVLSAAVAVLLAVLLAAKGRIHRFSRQWISAQEMRDGLLLASSALVVLPLLPNHAVDPWGLLNLRQLWLLVVLIMAISAVGHLTLRLVGANKGLPLAGFFAGFVSSTAAVAGFGERVRESPTQLRPAVAAAMMANLASVLLFLPITLAVSAETLRQVLVPLGAAASVLLVGGLLGLRGNRDGEGSLPTAERRMFRFRHALLFAMSIGLISAVANLVHQSFGPGASVLAATVAALAELHASAVSLAQLHTQGALDGPTYRWGVVGLLLASALAKGSLAWISGGSAYGLRVSAGLATMTAAAAISVLLG